MSYVAVNMTLVILKLGFVIVIKNVFIYFTYELLNIST
jgi:hypothetical protein